MSINKCKEAPEVIIIFLNSEWTSFPLVLIKRTLGNVVTTTNVQNGLFLKKKNELLRNVIIISFRTGILTTGKFLYLSTTWRNTLVLLIMLHVCTASSHELSARNA